MAQPAELLIIAILAFGSGTSSLLADDFECTKIKERIREIQSKMRSGYTRAQGEKLEAELRKLRNLRRKACR